MAYWLVGLIKGNEMGEKIYVMPDDGNGHGSEAERVSESVEKQDSEFQETVNAKLDAILAALAERN